MGIFGGTLGRAIYGAADAAQKASTDALDNEFQQSRQLTLEHVRQQFAGQQQQAQFAHEDTLQGNQQTFTAGQNAENRDFQQQMQDAGFTHADLAQQTAIEAAAKEAALNRNVDYAKLNILKQSADLDRQIKLISLKNALDVDNLRTQYQNTTDPTAKKQIADNISILTGKGNANYLPVPLKDESGSITGYQIFDKTRGQFVTGSNTKQPSQGDIQGLLKRKDNPQAVAAFESIYGPGSASKYVGTAQPAQSAPPKQPIPPAPSQPDAPSVPPLPTAAQPAAAALDQARAAKQTARDKMMRYGFVKMQHDPQGYAQAQSDFRDAQQAEQAALDAYQRTLGSAGNAYFGAPRK